MGEELLSECDWSSDDVIVLTVSEVFGSHETSFKSICLDEEHNLADMDREYDEVPVSKRELTGYIVSEKEALDNYVSGNLCQTNTHGDYVSMVGEIKENEMELSRNSDV